MELALLVRSCEEYLYTNLLSLEVADVKNDLSLEVVTKSYLVSVAVRSVY